MMEMAGLAQKGGAVHIHCRLAKTPGDIAAIRVAIGECDTLIGCDLVVSAGPKTLALMAPGRSRGVVNSHETVTGDFTRDTEFRIPGDRLTLSLEARLKDGLTMLDAHALAERMLGDSIYSNMLVFGAAWQLGQIPLGGEAIRRAIELNGAKVAENLRAFELGRWAAAEPEAAAKALAAGVAEMPKTLEEKIAFRAEHLSAYQSSRLAKRYRKLVDRVSEPVLKEAVAKGYHKALAIKDEYEVARLLTETRAKAEALFEGDLRLTWHLAPPVLGGRLEDGRPAKRAFGERFGRLWPLLAKMKGLRGTPLDPFGYSAERRMERRLLRQYERDMAEVLKEPGRNPEAAAALAELPLQIRGFGPVKEANAKAAEARREELLAAFRAGSAAVKLAAE